MRSPSLRGFTLVDVLVVVTVLAILMTMLLAQIQSSGRYSRRSHCQDNLKNIVLGMHNYATSNKSRLPGDRNKRSGGNAYKFNARFSMFADVLPFIEFDSVADRLNYKSPAPFLTTVGTEPRTGLLTEIIPAHETPTRMGEFPPRDAAGWVVGATDQQTINRHYEALQVVVPIFHCPTDMPIDAAKTAVSYGPVVTPGVPNGLGGGRFVQADGILIEAIWPPDDDSVLTAPLSAVPAVLAAPGTEGAGASFFDRLNPVTLDFLTGADGTSNTVGLVERVKGRSVAGRVFGKKNEAFVGVVGINGYVVNEHGTIVQDNLAQVVACQALGESSSGARTTADNALSGATYLQHTCAWLGCANMLAPPNTPVCRGSSGLLAQTGIVGPSSHHGGGANVGVMDGTVPFLTDQTDLKIMHAYGTPAGREQSHYEGD